MRPMTFAQRHADPGSHANITLELGWGWACQGVELTLPIVFSGSGILCVRKTGRRPSPPPCSLSAFSLVPLCPGSYQTGKETRREGGKERGIGPLVDSLPVLGVFPPTEREAPQANKSVKEEPWDLLFFPSQPLAGGHC